jgi:hypothetical protein
MSEDVVTKGIDHKKLRPIIDKVRSKIKKHPVVKKMFKKHKIDLNEIDLIPICFAKLDVSARTDHGVIYLNLDLLEDGDLNKDDHYFVHEITHYLQQTTGNKPTQGADEGEYLDNPAEIEGFQNQSEYLSDTRDEDAADEYINQVLDHHEYEGNKRQKKHDQLLRNAFYKSILKKGRAKWKKENVSKELFDPKKYESFLKGEGDAKDLLAPNKEFENVVKKNINNPYCFITFTKKPYVSTNYDSYFGKNKYNTPAGFYAYPIREIMKSSADFAKSNPYVIVTKSDPSKTLVFSKYTEQQLKQDWEKLKNKFPFAFEENEEIEKKEPLVRTLWNKIYQIRSKNKAYFTTAFVYLGYSVIYDDGFGIIHRNEPRQAIFLNPKSDINIVGIFNNIVNEVSAIMQPNVSDLLVSNYDIKDAKELLSEIDFDISNIWKLTDLEIKGLKEAVDFTKHLFTLLYLYKRTKRDIFINTLIEFNHCLPPKILSELSNDKNPYIREVAAKHTKTPPEDLDRLSRDKNNFIREEVAKNKSTLSKTLIELSKDKNESVIYNVSVNDNTPSKALFILLKHNNKKLNKNIACNFNTPSEILVELSKDENLYVRKGVASNKKTPPEILVELSKSIDFPDKGIKIAVAQNENTPPEILIELLDDENVRWHVVKNKNVPAEVFYKLVKSNDRITRETIALNENTPPEILIELLKDENPSIKKYIAQNKNTPPNALLELSKDENNYIIREVASNKSTPPEVLLELSKHKDKYIRGDVANNINAPIEALTELSKDKIPYIREAVAENKSTPLNLLEVLKNDQNHYVEKAAVENIMENKKADKIDKADKVDKVDKADKQLLRELYYQKDVLPIETLIELSKKSDRLSQIIAVTSKNATDEIFQNCINSRFPDVQNIAKTSLEEKGSSNYFEDTFPLTNDHTFEQLWFASSRLDISFEDILFLLSKQNKQINERLFKNNNAVKIIKDPNLSNEQTVDLLRLNNPTVNNWLQEEDPYEKISSKERVKLLRLALLGAPIKSLAQSSNKYVWARGIVEEAFKSVFGRSPTEAEAQIVMAVGVIESNFGKGWRAGKGAGSHNWGAVQTRSKTAPHFTHQDSSPTTGGGSKKYVARFKVYPDDVAGAADVVRLLFKSKMKQRMPDKQQRARGKDLPGPTRGELISAAAQNGDITAFSKAMFWTIYYEGFGKTFKNRIQNHAKAIQRAINKIATGTGKTPAWSVKTQDYLPVTDPKIREELAKKYPFAVSYSVPQTTTQVIQQPQQNQQQMQPQQQMQQSRQLQQQVSGLESMLWF